MLYPNRGHYYRVSSSRSKLVSRLVYPVPPPKLASLGIHITIDRAGQAKLGPDAEYINGSVPVSDWYKFDETRLEKFYLAVSRYFPSLQREDLLPDQVGVRPKVQGPGDPIKDFVIQEESNRGLGGLVNLIGIESPGLTCAYEIAKEVVGKFSFTV
jgi:L-2-hydroxyglutarate oxidase LhgO